MLTLPLEFAVTEVLPKVLDPNGGPWQGRDEYNQWTIARGVDDETGMPVLVILHEPLIHLAKE